MTPLGNLTLVDNLLKTHSCFPEQDEASGVAWR